MEMPESEILQALYTGNADRAQQLARDNDRLDVFEAAALGRTDRLRQLLDEDPSRANAWAKDGFQPLGLACFFGHPEAARELLERGAEVNSASRNDFNVMPLHSACAVREADTRYELARMLLEHGADPNAKQQDEFTPLMEANQNKDERLRDLLVEHGATA
jgi:ankyrin repeat protein